MDDRETRESKDWEARMFLLGRPTLPPPNGSVAVALFTVAVATVTVKKLGAMKFGCV